MKQNNKPIFKTVSLRSLLVSTVSAIIILCFCKDAYWVSITILLLLFYPIICCTFEIVNYYDDCIIMIRPLSLLHFKTIIQYEQVLRMEVPRKFFSMDIMDLLVYVKDRKRPIAFPLPFSSKQQNKLKVFIESKGINFIIKK